jgi:streptogramin lyase
MHPPVTPPGTRSTGSAARGRVARRWPVIPTALAAVALVAAPALVLAARARPESQARPHAQPGPPVWPATLDEPTSAAVLARLPDGEEKRKLILDCTGCHQLSSRVTYPNGQPRSEADWEAAVTRMLGYGGARGPFPVIHSGRDARATAAWLARHLVAPPAAPGGEPWRRLVPPMARWHVVEYAMSPTWELPHDLAVAGDGRLVITGMMTGRMYVLDSRTGTIDTVPVPVPRANPRAVEIDGAGRWWVALGAPQQVAVHDPAKGSGADAWRTFATGMYPHSVALAPDGAAWFNGHFTRAPALIGRIDLGASDGARRIDSVELARHPTMADDPAGPIPYEIRVAPDGVVWTSELHGNRLVAHDPRTRRTWAVAMPEAHSGPRRFDVAADGTLWIPAYAGNALVRYDVKAPPARRFTRIPLPVPDAVPYVARVDRATGDVWVGTAAADVLLRYTPRTGSFAVYPLPSRGALVRHLAIDPRTRDVWIAYGAAPGIAARVARLSLR